MHTFLGEDAKSGVFSLGAFKILDIPSSWENILQNIQLELERQGGV